MTTNKKVVIGILVLALVIVVYIIVKKKKATNKTLIQYKQLKPATLSQISTANQSRMSSLGLENAASSM